MPNIDTPSTATVTPVPTRDVTIDLARTVGPVGPTWTVRIAGDAEDSKGFSYSVPIPAFATPHTAGSVVDAVVPTLRDLGWHPTSPWRHEEGTSLLYATVSDVEQWWVLIEREWSEDVAVGPFDTMAAAEAHLESTQVNFICEDDALDASTTTDTPESVNAERWDVIDYDQD